MSRLPLGNLSWPDLSPRPSLPTGDTFPVKKGMKWCKCQDCPRAIQAVAQGNLPWPVQRLSARPSLPPLVINSRTVFVSANETISVALTRKTTINVRVDILFRFGLARHLLSHWLIVHLNREGFLLHYVYSSLWTGYPCWTNLESNSWCPSLTGQKIVIESSVKGGVITEWNVWVW